MNSEKRSVRWLLTGFLPAFIEFVHQFWEQYSKAYAESKLKSLNNTSTETDKPRPRTV